MLDRSLRAQWNQTDDSWRFDLPTGWMQGRSTFGGLTAAVSVALARRHLDPSRRLRSFTVQLLRPLVPGPVEGRYRIHRAGKHITFADVDLAQGEQPAALTRMVFADSRDDARAIAPTASWSGPDPESLVDMPYIAGVTPEFTQNVAFRWVSGGLPFTGSDQTQLAGYCRFRVPFGDVEGVVALLDAWPSPSLGMLRAPAAASTVHWSAHIAALPARFDGWFGFTYETVIATDGYHTVVGRLYDPDGALIASTEQLVALFDREGAAQ
ncbi:MAG: acyl-CoA thioesterase II [Haliangiales bacterium]